MVMKNQRGFTLIELLIAMFILAILSSVVAVGLRQSLKTRSVVIENQQQTSELQLALALIERDFLQQIDRPVLDSANQLRPAFIENSRNQEGVIEFTRMGYFNPYNNLPRSELQRVSFLRRNGQLIRQTWPSLDGSRDTELQSRVLLGGITQLTWRFMDKYKNFHSLWPPTARDLNTVPSAVEMTIAGNFGSYTRLFILPGQTYALKP
jgi:general secretion pathway protein J